MVWNDVLSFAEPKLAECRQYSAFFWNRIRQDYIECANPVGRDEQQRIAEIKDFTDFAATDFFQAGDFDVRDGLAHRVLEVCTTFYSAVKSVVHQVKACIAIQRR